MPIVRWHGWAAKCGKHGCYIDLSGDGAFAWEGRDNVLESLAADEYKTIEEAIQESCDACRKERRVSTQGDK